MKNQGYIKFIAITPLVVHLWTEGQVQLWHNIGKTQLAFLDARGTVIADWGGNRVLYYALAVPCPPLPIPELITSRHKVPTLSALFSIRQGSIILTWQRQYASTDQGKANILACLQEFNKETVGTFLKTILQNCFT